MLMKVIVAAVLVGICSLLVVVGQRTAGEQKRSGAAYQIEHDPLTLAVSNVGREHWHVSVNSAGKGELTVTLDVAAQRRQVELAVAKDEFDALRQLLLSERFFDLADTYGYEVPDHGTTTLTVIAGDELKTVQIHYVNELIKDDKRTFRELARALRVLELLYSWCDDPITTRAQESLQDVIALAQE